VRNKARGSVSRSRKNCDEPPVLEQKLYIRTNLADGNQAGGAVG